MSRFCTYHEYRFSYGLAALTGIMTGLTDATIYDWSVKAFTWATILMLYTFIASYEFIVMPTPPKPMLQALLFTLTAPMGLISAHHWTWYILSIMLGRAIGPKLWLAPNIYVSINTYNTIMSVSLVAYLVYLISANIIPCEKT